jgi:replicative DNA helicase
MNYETSFLGLIIKEPELLAQSQSVMNLEKPFITENFNDIFDDVKKLYSTTGKVDRRDLMKLGKDKNISPSLYTDLIKHGGFKESIHNYSAYIVDSAIKREIQKLSFTLVNCTTDETNTAQDFLGNIRKALEKIDKSLAIDCDVTLQMAVDEVIKKAVTLSDKTTAENHYLKTGILALDRIINGFQPKTMSVIGARPSVGKSALGLTILNNLTLSGVHCAFISVEMSEAECVERIIQIRSNVSVDDFMNDINSNQFYQFSLECDKLKKCDKMHIVRTTNRNISNIRAICNKLLNKDNKIKVIFIDYLQKLKGNPKTELREQIGDISATLTDMATDLNIHICALAQLNRDATESPKVKHLKESGNIEQDAHYIILIDRDTMQTSDIHEACLIVAKNRGGRVGIAQVNYRPSTTEFFDESFKTYANGDF